MKQIIHHHHHLHKKIHSKTTTTTTMKNIISTNITYHLILLFTLLLLLIGLTESKHHRRFSCSAQQTERCPIHKHKICGSDGKLYPSRCHLRRAACDTNTLIRPAHPDQCLKDEENDNNNNNINDNDDGNDKIFQLNQEDNRDSNDVLSSSSSLSINNKKELSTSSFATTKSSSTLYNNIIEDSSINSNLNHQPNHNHNDDNDNNNNKNADEDDDNNDNDDDDDDNVECRPKQYDLMKEKVLEKINDVSLLFTRLDENSDGQITLNELWKHSMIYKSPDSVCLLTDLMQHEDIDDDDKLDYTEFQAAFNKLFSVSMVTLDESLAINKIEAHLGDNVEIRCDITGEPQKPAIKWYRHGVDLSTLNLPYIKVFNDGSLYLTDLKLSFSGNYSCQAVNNPTVKQTHIVDVIVDPIVEVSPKFQWTPIGGVASFECRFETFEDDYIVHWFKNDEQLIDGPKVTIINNGTLLQVAALEQIDTGAYTCRITHKNGAFGQSVASLLVQDESVESSADISESHPQRLWIFHANGLTIYEGICGQTIHEIDARDIIYQNSLTLCGNGYSNNNNNNNNDDNEQTIIQCDWSEDIVQLNGLIYIAQPNLNRILVLHELQLSVVKVIATDPQPRRLRIVESSSSSDSQIWVLCDGNNIDNDDYNNYYDEQRSSSSKIPKDLIEAEWKNVGDYPTTSSSSSSSSAGNKFDYFNEKYRKNRKTIQVIRLMHDGSSSLSSSSAKQSSSSSFEYNNNNNRQPQPQSQSSSSSIIHDHIDVIHLQPVDGHFDLVYDFFIPEHYESIFKNDYNENMKKFMQNSPFAYATHWEERSLIKISINQLEYLHSIRLNDCQPIAVSIITRKAGGLLAVQCQTPITHQLNGQLILDQVTDAILIHNSHLNAHKSYLSPDHRYLVSIYHDFVNSSSSSSSQCQHGRRCHMMASKYSQKTNTETIITNTSTIIVQKINNNGIEFMYDVRTSLDIVNCLFVWKNGNYDLILASGTPNREDLLYLSLIDGHVELISGIGRPTEGYYRGMALSEKNRILSITATESVFTVDLVTNRILCESNKHFQKPKTLIWTN